MSTRIIHEKQDLKYLQWSQIRSSSGTAGSFLKATDDLQKPKKYYKLSNYDGINGIIGHECVNELITDRLLNILGIEHLHYDLIHAEITVNDKNIDTYLCKSEDFKNNGGTASPVYYEPATPAFNLAISEADKLKYELTGSVTTTLTVESLKDKDKDNILIMVTDADGKVHYITPDALDPKTGELTVTFTALGSVVILEKAPIVSKNLEADKYENEKVKAAAEQFKSAEEGTAVSDIFAAAGEDTTVKDQNGEDVDISQYKTCGSLVEVAMKLGDEYFTNAECQFEGTVQMDLEQVDYKALLKSAGIDENTSDEDLLNVEEFEAPDYVLAQLNAVSGEASVSTGLKFGFEKVEGSDRPVLVIKGTFNGLGPVALASKAE